MKRKVFYLLTLFLVTLAVVFSFSKKKTSPSQDIVVTTAPYKYFAKRLIQDPSSVYCLTSQDSDPHVFEPSSQEMLHLFKAKVWFLTGEPFEKNLSATVLKNNPSIQIIDLTKHIPAHSAGCSCHGDHDLHFWLSPKIAQKQTEIMASALMALYPEKHEIILKQEDALNRDFDRLDHSVRHLLKQNHHTPFLVSHPAFSYFAKDYDLHQLSLEDESADPSARKLTELTDQIQKESIETLFYQKQYNLKAAKQFADLYGLNMVELNPYSEDYFNNLLLFAQHLSR